MIRYPPGNLFYALNDVKRCAVYFDTKLIYDVPNVSTQEDMALLWEDFNENIFIVREREEK